MVSSLQRPCVCANQTEKWYQDFPRQCQSPSFQGQDSWLQVPLNGTRNQFYKHGEIRQELEKSWAGLYHLCLSSSWAQPGRWHTHRVLLRACLTSPAQHPLGRGKSVGSHLLPKTRRKGRLLGDSPYLLLIARFPGYC